MLKLILFNIHHKSKDIFNFSEQSVLVEVRSDKAVQPPLIDPKGLREELINKCNLRKLRIDKRHFGLDLRL